MSAPAGSRSLIVLAKQPVAGQVKTRLAASLGDAAAAELQLAFLRDTLAHCARVRDVERVLCHAPDAAADWFAELDPAARCVPQGEGDLGERLSRAFEGAFARGASAALVLGSDAPQLDAHYLERAFAQLGPGRVVFGPSDDGGITLVALAAPAARLFEQIPWSTPQVLAACERRARTLGLAVERLEPSFDIDDAADLQRLARGLAAGQYDCPATQSALRAGRTA